MNSALVFDLALVGIALVAGLGGILAGLVRELSGLCGVLVGVYVSTRYAEQAGEMLVKYGLNTQNHTLVNLLGFLILLIVIWMAFIVVGRIVSKAVSMSGLGLFDRIFGFIFGAGKFIIIAAVIATCINTVPFINKYADDYLKQSQTWPILISIGQELISLKNANGFSKLDAQINTNNENKEK